MEAQGNNFLYVIFNFTIMKMYHAHAHTNICIWSVPKVMRMIFCTALKGQERKVVVKAGGRGTQVYILTFLS